MKYTLKFILTAGFLNYLLLLSSNGAFAELNEELKVESKEELKVESKEELKIESKEEPKKAINYVSIKLGSVKNNDTAYFEMAKFAKDNGAIKDVEFLWGSKKYARILGGVKLDSGNKVINYFLGFMFNNQDIVSIKNSSINDELYKWDRFKGKVGTFGNINAKNTEYSYKWKSASRSDAYYHITYGKSSFPGIINVDGIVENGSTTDKTFIDPKPKFEYLYWGMDADPIRDALLEDQYVNEQQLGGDLFYGAIKFGFGLLKTKLSNVQYSSLYTPQPVNKLGLANAEGTDLYIPTYIEAGMYLQSKEGSALKGIGTLGAYWQSSSPFGMLYRPNSSTTGHSWTASMPNQWGIIGRLALTF